MKGGEVGIIENRALLGVCGGSEICRCLDHKGIGPAAWDDVNFRMAPGGADGGVVELCSAGRGGVCLARFVEVVAQK